MRHPKLFNLKTKKNLLFQDATGKLLSPFFGKQRKLQTAVLGTIPIFPLRQVKGEMSAVIMIIRRMDMFIFIVATEFLYKHVIYSFLRNWLWTGLFCSIAFPLNKLKHCFYFSYTTLIFVLVDTKIVIHKNTRDFSNTHKFRRWRQCLNLRIIGYYKLL